MNFLYNYFICYVCWFLPTSCKSDSSSQIRDHQGTEQGNLFHHHYRYVIKVLSKVTYFIIRPPTTILEREAQIGLDPILDCAEDDEAEDVFTSNQSRHQMTEEQQEEMS